MFAVGTGGSSDARGCAMAHPREEVEAAFAEYVRLGAEGLDWPAWAELFTDDAIYIEHNLGTFEGRESIKNWIVGTMAEFTGMTFAIDWAIIDGDRVAFYIWNLLPDPTGGDARYGFPNATVIEYAGDGKWKFEEDYYNPANADAEVRRWIEAGGRRNTPADRSLTAIPGFCPDPPAPAFPRDEVEAEFNKYVQRGVDAVASNDWATWAEQFTDDADYYEHHFGKMHGRDAIREWIVSVMQPYPGMEFPVEWYMIDGNRVVMRCPNVFPDPKTGERHSFPVLCVLHYAGDGRWSYEEDIYHPGEAEAIVNQLLA
jgi:predicted SnoaL-like aldol condensation-catalyzing enzyme